MKKTQNTFYPTLIKLALPIALQNLLAFAINFTDNLMVGTLGDVTISGVFMANNVHLLLQLLVSGVSASLLILAAQYWGKHEVEHIRSITSICLKASACVGIIFTVLSVGFPSFTIGLMTNDPAVLSVAVPYLRTLGFSFLFFSITQILLSSLYSIENVKTGMFVSLFLLFFNAALNYVLIFGMFGFPRYGAVGAAIATTVSRGMEMLIIMVYIFVVDKRLGMRLAHLRSFDTVLAKDLLRYGGPVVLGEIVWSANAFTYNAVIGRFGADEMAAFSIVGIMNTLVYVWISGLAAAVGIITGKMVSSCKNLDEIRQHSRRVQRLFLLVGLVSGLFIFFTKDILISFYTITSSAAETAAQLMIVLSVTIMGTCYQMPSLAGLVKAGGNTSFVFKNDTIFVFLIVIPSAIIAMLLNAPAWVVFACLKCDQILKCAVAVVVVNRYRWVHDLTVKESLE
jgi:putative efflux protein, MATE family